MQEQQHAETARKKEYLRQADEACRAVLSQCRRCGGYVFSVLVVMFIVKRYFKVMPLDMVPEERAFAGNHEDSSAEKAAQ